jgi:hypothetical protein
MYRSLFTLLVLLFSLPALAQLNPTVTSWIINTTGATGYSGIPSNVQKVEYSTANVYVSCTCIPGYDIGPWGGNPNIPANQNFVFKLTRTPVKNTGTPTAVGLGHIGVWTNGVSIFNARDAASYQNQDVWHQNAIIVEGPSFDTCLGHPAPNGEYHHHLNPRCLYNYKDGSKHAPIIGWAFDGFPIYGAYGYSDTNGTGVIKRMESSYRKRNITTRTILPDGSTAPNPGPAVSNQFPVGYYTEDFEYMSGLGDLDERNGRFCVTPEYPGGIYAYFVTLDSTLTASYPYTLIGNYYGVVQAGNTGPGSGHNTISETVVTYNPSNGLDIQYATDAFTIYPNPAHTDILVLQNETTGKADYLIVDLNGNVLLQGALEGSETRLNVSSIAKGIYLIRISDATGSLYQTKFVKAE